MMKKWKLTKMTLEPARIQFVEAKSTPETIEASGEPALPQFTLIAYTGGKVQTREIPLPLVVDMSGINIPAQKIPVRMDHNSSQGVGHTTKIAVVGTELIAEGVISRDTAWAKDVTLSAKNGFPWQISMGGPILEAEYIPKDQKVIVNGKTFEGEMYIVRQMTLKEVSFVDLGADSNTTAVVEAQYVESDNSETKTPQPKIEAAAVDTEKMMKDIQTKMLLDQRRIAAIEKIGGGKYPELEAKAIEEGWAVEKFHIEYQQRSMPDGSRVPMSRESQSGLTPTTLEAVALATSGCSLPFLETQYDEKTLNHIDKFRGIGIQEFCELASGGKYLPKYRRDSRGWLEAAFSSASLPGILSNVANKVLLEGFLQMDDTWKNIVKTASVNNFQQHQRYRMNGAFKFEKVGKDGALKHGEISEQQFSQQIGTHGIMFALTRQMIIDDDLGAFTDIPRAIGIGAADAISDAVWTCLLANNAQQDGKAFFSSDHKNLLNSGDTSLSIDGLTAAELAFSKQERSAGRALGQYYIYWRQRFFLFLRL
ncbi:hypothetical protein FACS1894170_02130 [Planctomycetales bacterium]|nr:hypothetical protein FACS1894170_02130 [Planctomycetales bacterium]